MFLRNICFHLFCKFRYRWNGWKYVEIKSIDNFLGEVAHCQYANDLYTEKLNPPKYASCLVSIALLISHVRVTEHPHTTACLTILFALKSLLSLNYEVYKQGHILKLMQ